MPAPTLTAKAARSAAQRMTAQRLVRSAGVALTVTLGAVTLGVLADRLVGPGLEQRLWWWGIGAGAFAACAFSAAIAWRRRPSDIDAAIRIDHALGLCDALSSGLQLHQRTASGETPDAFAEIAIEDAEAVARAASLPRAAPIRFDNWWAAWPAVGVAAVALTYVQPLDLLTDKRAKIEAAERVAEVRGAEQAIDEAARALEEIASAGPSETADAPPPEPHSERMQALDRLREQLASGTKSSDDARAEAAGELAKAADAVAEQARGEVAAQESVSRAMSALKPEALGERDSHAKRLAEALQSADAEGARQTAGDLAESLGKMTETQRREEAQRLDELARQLEELAARKQKDAGAPRDTQDELTRQGLSEPEAKSLAENADPRSAERELRERGFDEDAARRLAEKLAAERSVRQSRERAAEEIRNTAVAVRKAKEDLQRTPTPKPAPEATPPKPPATQPPASESSRQPKDTAAPPKPQSPGGEPPKDAPSQGQSQRNQPSPREENKPPANPDGSPSENNRPPTSPADPNASKGVQKGQERQPASGEQPDPARKPENAPSPTPSPNADPPNTEAPGDRSPDLNTPKPSPQPGATPESPQQGPPQPAVSPSEQRLADGETSGGDKKDQPQSGGQPAAQPPSETPQPGKSASGQGHGTDERDGGMQALKEQLDRMTKSPGESLRKMAESRRLRDQAQRMLEGMTPEQRRELERLAANRSHEMGNPAANPRPLDGVTSTPVDLRSPQDPASPGEREVLAEFNDPNAQVDRAAAPGTRPMQPSAQQTLKGVQKAIEEKQLPARYRNVENYFKRAVEREGRGDAPRPQESVKDAGEVAKPAGGS